MLPLSRAKELSLDTVPIQGPFLWNPMPELPFSLLTRIFWQDALADALCFCFSSVELVFHVS